MTTSAVDFFSLAEREASRYGRDSMVFLRELLQNARDADARRVVIETQVENGVEEIVVTDDGRGMAMDHAQRFLLTLYASSKRRSTGAAGRFGVGFWSILRFRPSKITIRSRAAEDAEGWDIVFDSNLNVLEHRRNPMAIGTSVRMERPAGTGDLGALTWDLVRRDARYLRQRSDSEEPVEVTINGRQATEKMVGEEPGSTFRRPGLRGVISLGSVPQVTLLAHGLRVRSAAFVDDLVLRPGRRVKESRCIPTHGLSPQVIVDSDRLAVLMDRGDVAQDRVLVAVAKIIRSETRRLCNMELERLAPRPKWRKAWDAVVAHPVAVVAGSLMLVGVVFGLWGATTLPERQPRSVTVGAAAAPNSGPEPYRDRSEAYAGPVTGTVDGVGGAPNLQYRPADQSLFFAAFRVSGIDEAGKPLGSDLPLQSAAVGGEADDQISGARPLEIRVEFRASGNLLRLPVPTGYVVESQSVVLNGQAAELWLTPDDEPIIRLNNEASGLVTYRTVKRLSRGHTDGEWPALPLSVAKEAASLKDLPPLQRVDQAINLVRISLRRLGELEGAISGDFKALGFLKPIFEAGGGDCDVVNTVLAAVLTEAGLRSRLAIGWKGVQGSPVPGLHAWVEVDLGEGRWIPADATVTTRVGTAAVEEDGPLQSLGLGPKMNPPVAGRDFESSTVWWAVGLFAGVLSAGLAVACWHFRVRREFKETGDLDPGPLVESLVRDRGAWPGFSGAWRRPLVPGLGTGCYSMAKIERAASQSTVFVAESPSEWVSRVEEGNHLVIDGATRAGRVAAAACGAFDLDRWDVLWKCSHVTAFALEVQSALQRTGLNLELRNATDIEGGALGLVVESGARAWVVFDEAHPDWKQCRQLIKSHRTEAIFRAADAAVETLPISGPKAEMALATLAHSALMAAADPCVEGAA